MSTPLNELQQSNAVDNIEDTENNSELVNQILNEMNSNTNNEDNSNQLQNTENENLIAHQMDPNIDMNNLDLHYQQQPQQSIQVETQENISLKDRILNNLKQPLLVFIILFLTNMPLVTNNLSKFIPKLYSNLSSPMFQYIGIIIQAIVGALVFFGVNQVLN